MERFKPDPEIELTPDGEEAAKKIQRLERLKRIQRDKRLGRDVETTETIEQLVEKGFLDTWTKDGEPHYRVSKKGKSYMESREELRETIQRLTEEGKIELAEDEKDKDKPIVEVPDDKWAYFPYRRKGYLHFKHELDLIIDKTVDPKKSELVKKALTQEPVFDHTLDKALAHPESSLGDTFLSTLNRCKVFDVDENVIKLLLLTNNEIVPKKPMPFESIFINADIEIDGYWYKGLMLTSEETTDNSLMLMTFTDGNKNQWPCDEVVWYQLDKNTKPASTLSKALLEEFQFGVEPIEKRNYKKLAMFCMNFLDFLNNPDVQVVEFTRSQKNIERRKRKGKEVLPSTKKVVVRGDLKRYMEHIHTHLENFHYTHRFWVRGHYMRFWNREKFHHMYSLLAAHKLHKLNRRHVRKDGSIVSLNYEVDPDGTIKVFKWPFIKGEGILIEKSYEVKK